MLGAYCAERRQLVMDAYSYCAAAASDAPGFRTPARARRRSRSTAEAARVCGVLDGLLERSACHISAAAGAGGTRFDDLELISRDPLKDG